MPKRIFRGAARKNPREKPRNATCVAAG